MSENFGSCAQGDFQFKVKDLGEGEIKVFGGGVNSTTIDDKTFSSKPDEIWLKVTFDDEGVVDGGDIVTSAGSTSATEDYRMIADIYWDGDVPEISQGIGGAIDVTSCGTVHQFHSLYDNIF